MKFDIKRALRIGSRINGSTVGSVLFIDTNLKIAEDNANLFWDNTNNRFGIGTNTPTTALEVGGVITATGGTSTQWNTAYTHSQDNTQAHSDYLINNGNDTTSGILTVGGLDLVDNNKIRLGTGLDVVIDYDNGNNSLDIDLTGGVSTKLRILTDNSGEFGMLGAGMLTQTVNKYSQNTTINYDWGGVFQATRSGTQAATNQIANGWKYTFNEEANNATRGVNVFKSTLNYSGDGGGGGYFMNNAQFIMVDSSSVGGSVNSATLATYRYTAGNSGTTTYNNDVSMLTTTIGLSNPFTGAFNAPNVFGIKMTGNFGLGSGTFTVTDTFAHLSATEFYLQPTEVSASLSVNLATATNAYFERMLFGTSKSAFHLATSGTADGGQILLGKQGNASIYIADGGDLVFNPALQVNSVLTATINNAGTGYRVNGIHLISGGGGGSTARIQITSISGGGASGQVTGIRILDIGKNYSATTGAATIKETFWMGGNNNLTLNITVNPSPALSVVSKLSVSGDLILPKTSGKGIKVDTTTPTFGFRDIVGTPQEPTTGGGKPSFLQIAMSGVYTWKFTTADVQYYTWHIPHDYVPGSDIYFHTHWFSETTVANNTKWQFDYLYARGHNQSAYPTTATSISVEQTDSTTAYQHMIAETTAQTIANLEPDGVIICKVSRVTPSGTDVTVPVFVPVVDLHYQSTNMATKQKAPNFYV